MSSRYINIKKIEKDYILGQVLTPLASKNIIMKPAIVEFYDDEIEWEPQRRAVSDRLGCGSTSGRETSASINSQNSSSNPIPAVCGRNIDLKPLPLPAVLCSSYNRNVMRILNLNEEEKKVVRIRLLQIVKKKRTKSKKQIPIKKRYINGMKHESMSSRNPKCGCPLYLPGLLIKPNDSKELLISSDILEHFQHPIDSQKN